MPIFYVKKPDDFHVELEVSTVFIECEKKLLLVQRSPHKIAPNTWAIPGGKLEKKETALEGLLREIAEELELYPAPEDLKYIKSAYVKHPIMRYHLHLFKWTLDSIPIIKLNRDEHQAFLWQPIEEFNNLPLLDGQFEAFRLVYSACLK